MAPKDKKKKGKFVEPVHDSHGQHAGSIGNNAVHTSRKQRAAAASSSSSSSSSSVPSGFGPSKSSTKKSGGKLHKATATATSQAPGDDAFTAGYQGYSTSAYYGNTGHGGHHQQQQQGQTADVDALADLMQGSNHLGRPRADEDSDPGYNSR